MMKEINLTSDRGEQTDLTTSTPDDEGQTDLTPSTPDAEGQTDLTIINLLIIII